jgi:hypothetical protein
MKIPEQADLSGGIPAFAQSLSSKGYVTGRMEFLVSIRSSGDRLHKLHQTIKELTCELKTAAQLDDTELRFVQSSEVICAALEAVYDSRARNRAGDESSA